MQAHWHPSCYPIKNEPKNKNRLWERVHLGVPTTIE